MTERELPQFARIESAIARIETALARRSPSRSDADYAHLAARHDILRAEVLTAIQDLATVGDAVKMDR